MKVYRRQVFFVSFFALMLVIMTGCAYRWGAAEKSLPGGYKQVFVPIFKNYSQEPGIEVNFTNALKLEMERAKIARITDKENAELIVEGEILSVTYSAAVSDKVALLPTGTVLATQYNIVIGAKVRLKKRADNSIVWEGDFSSERTYNPPQVTLSGVNTVNPLYNLSARRQNIGVMATTMMTEVHDRMTENF